MSRFQLKPETPFGNSHEFVGKDELIGGHVTRYISLRELELADVLFRADLLEARLEVLSTRREPDPEPDLIFNNLDTECLSKPSSPEYY
jgi:hypothetical protein